MKRAFDATVVACKVKFKNSAHASIDINDLPPNVGCRNTA